MTLKLARRCGPAVGPVTSDHNESLKLSAASKADAFANDDVQLYRMQAETKTVAQ